MKALFLAIALATAPLTLHGASQPVVRLDFSNPGLTPSQWTLEFHPDGRGHFRSERGNADRGDKHIEAPDIDRDIQVSPKFAAHAFLVAQHHKFFNAICESHMKVAFQGTKKLSYEGPEGTGSCEFNYSRNAEIQELGDSLVAVATTLIEGARLETLYQHDPLGLDQEIQNVQDAVADGRAQQICSIQGILLRLADDPAILDRVRKRARELLAHAEQ
jgi:hypothetical protein